MSSSLGRSGRASVRRGGGSCSWAWTAARLDLRPNGAVPARQVKTMQASEYTLLSGTGDSPRSSSGER